MMTDEKIDDKRNMEVLVSISPAASLPLSTLNSTSPLGFIEILSFVRGVDLLVGQVEDAHGGEGRHQEDDIKPSVVEVELQVS